MDYFRKQLKFGFKTNCSLKFKEGCHKTFYINDAVDKVIEENLRCGHGT
jgi:hypothetical protein